MNSFDIGAMMSAPTFKSCAPRIHDRLSMNSNWFVCWNFGRKSGEPRRPRPDPPNRPVIEMPGKPPATSGFVTEPGIVAAGGAASPNGCCTASDVERDHDSRNSFNIVDDSTFV